MIATLTGIWWDLKVILICIFLVAKDVEWLCLCLLATYISPFEDYLFSLLSYLLIGRFDFFLVFASYISSSTLDINPLSDAQLTDGVFSFHQLSLHSVDGVRSVLISHKYICQFLGLFPVLLDSFFSLQKTPCLCPGLSILHVFSPSRSFTSYIKDFDPSWIGFYAGWALAIGFHSSLCGNYG